MPDIVENELLRLQRELIQAKKLGRVAWRKLLSLAENDTARRMARDALKKLS